jgi:hypothetical protein
MRILWIRFPAFAATCKQADSPYENNSSGNYLPHSEEKEESAKTYEAEHQIHVAVLPDSKAVDGDRVRQVTLYRGTAGVLIL